MPIRKLKPIEERDPYAASVLAEWDRQEAIMEKNTAALIATEAVEFLARKHNVTVAQIEQACRAGDMSVIKQIAQLLAIGIAVAA